MISEILVLRFSIERVVLLLDVRALRLLRSRGASRLWAPHPNVASRTDGESPPVRVSDGRRGRFFSVRNFCLPSFVSVLRAYDWGNSFQEEPLTSITDPPYSHCVHGRKRWLSPSTLVPGTWVRDAGVLLHKDTVRCDGPTWVLNV